MARLLPSILLVFMSLLAVDALSAAGSPGSAQQAVERKIMRREQASPADTPGAGTVQAAAAAGRIVFAAESGEEGGEPQEEDITDPDEGEDQDDQMENDASESLHEHHHVPDQNAPQEKVCGEMRECEKYQKRQWQKWTMSSYMGHAPLPSISKKSTAEKVVCCKAKGNTDVFQVYQTTIDKADEFEAAEAAKVEETSSAKQHEEGHGSFNGTCHPDNVLFTQEELATVNMWSVDKARMWLCNAQAEKSTDGCLTGTDDICVKRMEWRQAVIDCCELQVTAAERHAAVAVENTTETDQDWKGAEQAVEDCKIVKGQKWNDFKEANSGNDNV